MIEPSRKARFALAILSGVLVGLSFESFGVWPLAFLGLTPLLVALARARSWPEATLLGWISAAVMWLVDVPWVIIVMSQYGGLPYPVGVALFIAMAIYLGVFGALFGVLVYRIDPATRPLLWTVVPLAWAVVEFARAHLFAGFPWNLLVTAAVDLTPLIQLVRVFGPYLTGALVAAPAAMAAWLIVSRPARRGQGIAFAALATGFGLWWWGGATILASEEARISREPKERAVLLQPNISQQMRWDSDSLSSIYGRMMEMTLDAASEGTAIIIWPESTVPLAFLSTDFYQSAIETVSRESSADVILGSVAEDPRDSTKLWNAAYLVSSGKTSGRYDKIKLVPFGEFVPMRKLLFFAEKLVRAVGTFQFGTNEQPLRGRHAYGMAICYEIVFPQMTLTQVRNGATVLVTITNDAWFGDSAAPYQHLAMARVRAVETNRYILRAATTGISAAVDPTGRVTNQLGLDRQGSVVATFAPRQTTTPYVRFGDVLAWLAVIVTAAAVVRRTGKQERQ